MLNPTAYQNFNKFITLFQCFITKIGLNVQYFFPLPLPRRKFLIQGAHRYVVNNRHLLSVHSVCDQPASLRSDIAEDGFTWCGCGAANAEAEGITISRLDVGVYVLTGSAGLASEGWQLLPPMDPGGMGELGVVEAEQTENGGLTIRLFKRKYLLGDDGEIVKTKGEPMDVPANSWIDVRLDRPTDSVFRREQYSLQSDGED